MEHRFDQIAGHPGEFQQALHVFVQQWADDVLHVTAGTEVALMRGEGDSVAIFGGRKGTEPVAQLGVAVESQGVLAVWIGQMNGRDAVRNPAVEMFGF